MSLRLACILLIIACIGCDSTSNLKDPNDSYFIKYYGGDGDQTGDDFVEMPDGSFILFGTTRPSLPGSASQWYLVKVDAKGNVIHSWGKNGELTFGGTNDEEARDIELTNDNRIVLVGNTYKSPTDRDILIMTLNLDGSKIDSAVVPIYTSVGANPLGDEDAASVTQTADGFIVAGSTTYVTLVGKPTNPGYTDSHDGISIRLNNNLTTYTLNGWPLQQSYGYYSDDVTQKIYQLPNVSFYLFGYSNRPVPTQTAKNYNFWYYQIGISGGPISYNLLGIQTEDEKLSSVNLIPLESGNGYLLSGLTTDASGTSYFTIARLKNVLNFNPPAFPPDELYQKSLSIKLGSALPEKTSVFATRANTYYVLANEDGFNGNQNWILTKGDINDGTAIWSLPIAFGGEGLDISGSVQELPDGRVALLGTMRTGKPDVGEFKMTLIKVSPDGKLAD